MTSTYIPPHLRGGDAKAPVLPKSNKQPEQRLYSLQEIGNHYWPDNAWREDVKSRTLHNSAQNPSGLSHLLLFKDANPRWAEERIIYVKTNLDLLPVHRRDRVDPSMSDCSNSGEKNIQVIQEQEGTKEQEQDTHTQNDKAIQPDTPIAVFDQGRRSSYSSRIHSFSFDGYYRISRLVFLEPNSPDLVRMLEQKFTRKNRSGRVMHYQRDKGSWQASLAKRWAVVKLEKDEAADERLGRPDIVRIEHEQHTEVKSVNDMLKELRMKGEGKEKAVEGDQQVDVNVEADTAGESVDQHVE